MNRKICGCYCEKLCCVGLGRNTEDFGMETGLLMWSKEAGPSHLAAELGSVGDTVLRGRKDASVKGCGFSSHHFRDSIKTVRVRQGSS